MFSRILVPLDGSASAETALPVVEALRSVFGSTVTLIHLLERDAPRAIHGQRHLGGELEACTYLNEVAGCAFLQGAIVERHVHGGEVGDVPQGLAEHALELNQDLVVLCVHGHGGLRRLFEGAIGERIMRHQTAPVLLLRSEDAPSLPFRRVLLALDGEPEHEQSYPLILELAVAMGASVDLATIIPTRSTLKGTGRAAGLLSPSATRESLRLSEAEADSYLEGRAEKFAARGIAVTTNRRRGDPARQLEHIARERGSDLVVLGTHGRTGSRAFWAESAAVRIMARTKLPTLLVPSTKGIAR
jgi:nucleotide-binding universal stress UspA family protein